MINTIISGGQTGADMGALLAAELVGMQRGGYCPKDFSDENGFNDEFIPRFGLTPAGSLKERTVYNIAESDATVIFARNLDSAGTKMTIDICNKVGKPFYVVKSLNGLRKFLYGINGTVNVAGNRESVSNGIQDRVRDFLSIALMPENGVFVFGSNSEGAHGSGAAKVARDYFGAQNGVSEGLMGRSYAIVTKKDFRHRKSSSLDEIREGVDRFYEFAKGHKNMAFYVTELGCHLAGYHYTEIAKLFERFYEEELYNVVLPVRFNPHYFVNKMMMNSSIAGRYDTLDETESALIRQYFEKEYFDKFGFSTKENVDIFIDEDKKLCSKVERVVVGDHGPYIEFKPENILVDVECVKGKEFKHDDKYKNTVKYFDENPVGYEGVLLYNQQKTVSYADYKAGMYYVSPYDLYSVKRVETKEVYLNKIEKRIDVIVEEKEKPKEEKKIEKGNFVHLHVHSSNSLLDGLCEFPELFAKMKEIGQTTIALTDHGYLYGNYKFQKEADKEGIIPIHGVETYFANDALKKEDRSAYHLILLCMNETGWRNLCKMMTLANRDRFYYKPRIDEALLKEYNDGLICTSACYKSPISYHLTEEGYDPKRAENNARFLQSVFGDRFYNEVMHIGFHEYDSICPRILELADKLGLRTCCTNDVHYVKKEDAALQETLMNINTEGALKSESDQLYLKSREEMIIDYVTDEMCDTTLEIADRCKFRLDFSGYKFPKFDITKQNDYDIFKREVLE